MKIIVAGSRTFADFPLLRERMDVYTARIAPDVEVISGAARGADEMGELWAKSHGYTVKRFPADWDKYGKRAGITRNEEMGRYADALVAFWDGESRGTKHMIEYMQSLGKPVKVVKP